MQNAHARRGFRVARNLNDNGAVRAAVSLLTLAFFAPIATGCISNEYLIPRAGAGAADHHRRPRSAGSRCASFRTWARGAPTPSPPTGRAGRTTSRGRNRRRPRRKRRATPTSTSAAGRQRQHLRSTGSTCRRPRRRAGTEAPRTDRPGDRGGRRLARHAPERGGISGGGSGLAGLAAAAAGGGAGRSAARMERRPDPVGGGGSGGGGSGSGTWEAAAAAAAAAAVRR